jgi:hypothetical protein
MFDAMAVYPKTSLTLAKDSVQVLLLAKTPLPFFADACYTVATSGRVKAEYTTFASSVRRSKNSILIVIWIVVSK